MREGFAVFLWLSGVAACAAQTSPAPSRELTFDVASVKPHARIEANSSLNWSPGGRLDAENVTVRGLITFAYRIRDAQLIGGPDWLDTDRYDIHAKAPDGEPAATDFFDRSAAQRVRLRTRALLADRFGLVLRSETREMPVYILTVAKNGPKPGLKPWKEGDEQGPQNIGRVNSYTAKKVSMKAFAEGYLSSRMGRVVLDETGLSGDFNFTLDFVPDQATDQKGPSFLDALVDVLGLKISAGKAAVDVMAIERVERPGAN